MRYLRFSDMSFSRYHAAWCPITGQEYPEHSARIVNNFILEPIVSPHIYYRFPEAQGFTAYNNDPGCYHRDGETTDYLTDWMTVLEECNPSVERILLGQSYEGRDIEAFRLGPKDRQHFVLNCVIHGNESDGLPGSLKAMEILLTHPDFAPLRDNFTLFCIPCCNPDGFYFGTRDIRKLGPHPSGVDQYINLNRVWPWFWDEFTPSSNESKGAEPLDCPEAQAMYLWRTQGNDGQPTPVRFLMDQHSTAGDGARYQSRDRHFTEIDEYDWHTAWADYMIYRHLKTVQSKRVREDNAPDLFVNYYRSRYVPHWHTWNSTLPRAENGGVASVCMVNEYNKVAYVTVDTDPETYKSACDYTLDYLLSCALVMQGGYYEARDAVLIESQLYGEPYKVAVNDFENNAFVDWNEATSLEVPEYRPAYWSKARAEILQGDRNNRFLNHPGRQLRLNPTLKFEVPANTTVGPLDTHDVQSDKTTPTTLIVVSSLDSGGFSFSNWSGTTTLVQLEVDTVSDNTQQLRLAGGIGSNINYVLLGTASVGISLVKCNGGVRSVLTTYASARMNAATAWDATNSKLYIVGGETSAGVYTRTVLIADTSGAGTITELGTNLLTTADSGGEAVFCVGGTLDGKIAVVGGKEVDASKLRVVVIDPTGPSATEHLITLTGSTLPRNLISCALVYDGVNTLWIYGGEDPATGNVHQGVWTLRWKSSSWTVTDKSLLADIGDDGDPEDYGGTSYWSRYWTRWRAVRTIYDDTGLPFVFLLGGAEEDASTGDLLPGPYMGAFVHDVTDDTLTRPEDQNYAYTRTNVRFVVFAYNTVSTCYNFKAGDSTTSGYVRINNAPGSAATGTLTTRRTRTYYMHPPRWWWWEHASLDLTAGDPLDLEDEWRAYVREYQDNQELQIDAPIACTGTLWPFSWTPYTRDSEYANWSEAFDPRWFHLSFTLLPMASYLCLNSTAPIMYLKSYDGEVLSSYFLLEFIQGDPLSRTYVRDQVHGMVDPVIRITKYDGSDPAEYCEVIVYWGGYSKDTARGRFDSPITIDVWQHASYGFGLIVNNAGAIGQAYVPGKLNLSLWGSSGEIDIRGGGWWAEPKTYEITDSWVLNTALRQDPTGAIVLGDRDATWGQVSERSTFKYVERFTRADDINLGSFWDVIQQTGDGWDIHSNQARCSEVGWERWDAYPYLRDVSIIGDVKIGYVGGRIGFFTRIHWGRAVSSTGDGIAHGYLGTLHSIATDNVVLEIEHVYYDAGSQGRVSLATVSCPYTINDTVELEFEAIGSTLNLIARSGETVLATCTVVDTNHIMPGAFGICGETTSGSRYVYLDSVRAEVRGTNKIRITD